MTDKLVDAIDHLQDKLDNGEPIDYTDSEELKAVLEAAWRYWDLQDGEGDSWNE